MLNSVTTEQPGILEIIGRGHAEQFVYEMTGHFHGEMQGAFCEEARGPCDSHFVREPTAGSKNLTILSENGHLFQQLLLDTSSNILGLLRN